MVVDQTFEGGAWLGGKKRSNLGGLRLLKEIINVKIMLK
jgi:hypothetical protein